MKISYKWLQTFFEQPLPPVDKLVETSNFKIVEVEGTEEIARDTIIDLKILADRAAYMLSHQGVAREFAATLDLKLKNRQITAVSPLKEVLAPKVNIDSELCRRYTARRVEGIRVRESPEWLKSSLTKLGQRSINNIVDLANFVMFDIGQPLHAFDADKVQGSVVIRLAKEGEIIETLDDRRVTLREQDLVIADDAGPIAIAGVKGGKRAGVTEATTNLLLESANFNPSSVRKTSTSLGLRTDASKRFENNLTADLCLEALENFSALITEAIPTAQFSAVTDIYPKPEETKKILINPNLISERLGMEVPRGEQGKILARMGLEPRIVLDSKDGLISVKIPTYRRDLSIPEDFAEEIGRIWGYDKLPETLPAPVPVKVNKEYYYTEKVRNLLRDFGFSEVYLYSLVSKGELEVQLPLADDKKCYRHDLSEGLQKCLTANRPNLALLDATSIDIFEIGHVYEGSKEKLKLGIASTDNRRINEGLASIADLIGKAEIKNNVRELDWGEALDGLPEPNSYDDLGFELTKSITTFKQYSQYPFILRDIATWLPDLQTPPDAEKIIKSEGGEWLVRVNLFDQFSKNDKTSCAFRLVFQSMDRTLTDEDVNAVIARITKALTKEGYIIR